MVWCFTACLTSSWPATKSLSKSYHSSVCSWWESLIKAKMWLVVLATIREPHKEYLMWASTFPAARQIVIMSKCTLPPEKGSVGSRQLHGVPIGCKHWRCMEREGTQSSPWHFWTLCKGPRAESAGGHTLTAPSHPLTVCRNMAWLGKSQCKCIAWLTQKSFCVYGKMTKNKAWVDSFIIKIIFSPTSRKAEGHCKRGRFC